MKRITFLIFIILFASAHIAFTESESIEKRFTFSEQKSLNDWEEKIFKGRVHYSVEEMGQLGQVRALSDKAASSMYYKIKFKPQQYPMISWKWQVLRLPSKITDDIKSTKFEEYAARIMVIFPSGFFPNSKALEYIWDNKLPVGTIFSSPYTANVKILVLQSGEENKGKWIFEERNIYEDYKKAFGSYPKLRVGAIAFMTNSDNSQDKAEALYTGIRIGYK